MTLQFTVDGIEEKVTVPEARTVVAGYTGADEEAVQRHIEELAAIGVPPPATVPTFYPMPSGAATQAPSVVVPGSRTSGEVEPVIVRAAGRLYLGVGSDHTDRELERDSVQRSKEVCPKPLGSVVMPLPLDGFNWQRVRLRCSVDGQTYQDGSMSALRSPVDVLGLLGGADDDGADVVLFGGTLPLLTGGFVYGRFWELSLTVEGVGEIHHSYTINH